MADSHLLPKREFSESLQINRPPMQANLYPSIQTDDLIQLLRAHVPEALPVLGSLSSVGEVTELYTSFLPNDIRKLAQQQEDGGRPFFIVLAHMAGGNDGSGQGRIYCSSEQNAGSDCDAQLVYAFVKSYLGLLPPGTSRFFGAINHRWVNALRPNTSYVSPGPVAQWIAPPSESFSHIAAPQGYYLDRLAPRDVKRIIETSKVPRTRAYILSRLPYSMCIRTSDADTLVAWGILHSDCSVGTVFVEPEHRGKGLGKVIVRGLPLHCGRDTSFGWEFTNVVAGNDEGKGLFGALSGWSFAWDTFWMAFVSADQWMD